jgi:hypothetical protein
MPPNSVFELFKFGQVSAAEFNRVHPTPFSMRVLYAAVIFSIGLLS